MKTRGRIPEFFEVVVGANRRLHDVNHDVAAIDQYPFAGVFAFGGRTSPPLSLTFSCTLFASARVWRVAGRGGDDDAVKFVGQTFGVQDCDVLGFHVVQGINDDGF